jgi:predicted phosphate transport protein (TIGR00153 family)
MQWFKNMVRPDKNDFMKLLAQQGGYATTIVEALQEYLQDPGKPTRKQAKQVEREADEIQRILIHELNDTFVTPLDREDINALSRALDNFIDYVYTTVEELTIFKMQPTPELNKFAELLMDMAQGMSLAMERLDNHGGVANEHARSVKKLENQIEDLYRHTLAHLFDNTQTVEELVDMLKMREVLRHISNAADQGVIFADTVQDINIKVY